MHPWLSGIIDGLAASNLVRSSNIPHRNRIALIILDSTIEIVFKKYLENVKNIRGLPDNIWQHREQLLKVVKKHTDFQQDIWDELDYFYQIRTGLYHEDSEKTVTDETIRDFQESVEFITDNLFAIQCLEVVPLTTSLLPSTYVESDEISINRVPERINVILVAVAASKSRNAAELNEVLKRKGFRGKIPNSVISANLNHHYSHLFYFKEFWRLSDEGQRRYDKIRKSYLEGHEKESNEGTK